MDPKDKTRCGSCKAEKRHCQYELLYDEAQLQIDSLQRQVRHLRVEAQARSEEYDVLSGHFHEYRNSHPGAKSPLAATSSSGENPSCPNNQSSLLELKEKHTKEMHKVQHEFAKERAWWKREVQRRDSRIMELESLLKAASQTSSSGSSNTPKPQDSSQMASVTNQTAPKPGRAEPQEISCVSAVKQNEQAPRIQESESTPKGEHNLSQAHSQPKISLKEVEKKPLSAQVKNVMDSLFGEDSDGDNLCSSTSVVPTKTDLPETDSNMVGTAKTNPKVSASKKISVKSKKTSSTRKDTAGVPNDEKESRDRLDKKETKPKDPKGLGSKTRSKTSSQKEDKSTDHKHKQSDKEKGKPCAAAKDQNSGNMDVDSLERPPSRGEDTTRSRMDRKYSQTKKNGTCHSTEQASVSSKHPDQKSEKSSRSVASHQGCAKEQRTTNKQIVSDINSAKSGDLKEKPLTSPKEPCKNSKHKESKSSESSATTSVTQMNKEHASLENVESKTSASKTRKRKLSDSSEYSTTENGVAIKRTKSCSESSVSAFPLLDVPVTDAKSHSKSGTDAGVDQCRSNKEKTSKAILPRKQSAFKVISPVGLTKDTDVHMEAAPPKKPLEPLLTTTTADKSMVSSSPLESSQNKSSALLKTSAETKLKPNKNPLQKSRVQCPSKNSDMSDKDRLQAYINMAEKHAIERNKSSGYPKASTCTKSTVKVPAAKHPVGSTTSDDFESTEDHAPRNPSSGIAGDLGWLKMCKASTSTDSSPCKLDASDKTQVAEYHPTAIGDPGCTLPSPTVAYKKPKFKYQGRAPPKPANGPSKINVERRTPWPSHQHEEYDPFNPEIKPQHNVNIQEAKPLIDSYSTKSQYAVGSVRNASHRNPQTGQSQEGAYGDQFQHKTESYHTSGNTSFPANVVNPPNLNVTQIVGNLASQVNFSGITSHLLNDVKKALDTVRSVSPTNICEVGKTDPLKVPTLTSEKTNIEKVTLPSPLKQIPGDVLVKDPRLESSKTCEKADPSIVRATNGNDKTAVKVPIPSPLKRRPDTKLNPLSTVLSSLVSDKSQSTSTSDIVETKSEARFADLAVKSGMVRRKRKEGSQTKSILKKPKGTNSSDDVELTEMVQETTAVTTMPQTSDPVEDMKVKSANEECPMMVTDDGCHNNEVTNVQDAEASKVGKTSAVEHINPEKPSEESDLVTVCSNDKNNLESESNLASQRSKRMTVDDGGNMPDSTLPEEPEPMDLSDKTLANNVCAAAIQCTDELADHPVVENTNASQEVGKSDQDTEKAGEVCVDGRCASPSTEDASTAAVSNNSLQSSPVSKSDCEGMGESSLFDSALNVDMKEDDATTDINDISTMEFESASPDLHCDLPEAGSFQTTTEEALAMNDIPQTRDITQASIEANEPVADQSQDGGIDKRDIPETLVESPGAAMRQSGNTGAEEGEKCVIKQEPADNDMTCENNQATSGDHTATENTSDDTSKQMNSDIRQPENGKNGSFLGPGSGDDSCMIVISDSDSDSGSSSSGSSCSHSGSESTGSSYSSDESEEDSCNESSDASGSEDDASEDEESKNGSCSEEDSDNSEDEDSSSAETNSGSDSEEMSQAHDQDCDQDSENSDESADEHNNTDSDSVSERDEEAKEGQKDDDEVFSPAKSLEIQPGSTSQNEDCPAVDAKVDEAASQNQDEESDHSESEDEEPHAEQNKETCSNPMETMEDDMEYTEDVLELHPTGEFELDLENTNDGTQFKERMSAKPKKKDLFDTCSLFEEGEIVSEESNMIPDKTTRSRRPQRNVNKRRRSRPSSSQKENDRSSARQEVRRSPRKRPRSQQRNPRSGDITSPRSTRQSPRKTKSRYSSSERSHTSRTRETRVALHDRRYSSNKVSNSRSRR